jgi:hypothetical protein
MIPGNLPPNDLPLSRRGSALGRAILAAFALSALVSLEPRLLADTLDGVAACWSMASSLAFAIGQWGSP